MRKGGGSSGWVFSYNLDLHTALGISLNCFMFFSIYAKRTVSLSQFSLLISSVYICFYIYLKAYQDKKAPPCSSHCPLRLCG